MNYDNRRGCLASYSKRLRSILLGGLALSAVFHVSSASAKQFSSIFAFGDSYTDTGNEIALINKIPPLLSYIDSNFIPYFGAAFNQVYPTGRFSGGTNYVDNLSSFYGIPQYNVAYGGALTGSTNEFPFSPGFAQQWQNFPGIIPPSALVTLTIGGNDARAYYQNGGSMAGVPAAATQSAQQAMAGINALVADGARTLVFYNGNVTLFPEAALYPPSQVAVGSAYSQAYAGLMEQSLAKVAASGVRVEYIDGNVIGLEVAANPGRYGLSSFGVCPNACIGNPSLQNQYLFYVDGTHLTSAGFAIVAAYVENRLNAPLTFGPTGQLGLSAAGGFVGSLFGRLDLFNAAMQPAHWFMAYAGPTSSEPQSPWSFFMQANGGIGDRSATDNSSGYSWDGLGGNFGLEYRLAPNVLIGAAYDYSAPNLTLNAGAGKQNVTSNQIALYGAYDGPNFFAQGLLSYGWLNYSLSRPGVVSTLAANPNGDTFAAAFKIGHLFDIAPATRLGPIAGLTYVNAHIDSYTETGDLALNLNVKSQNADALLGAAGAQLRYLFTTSYGPVDTFFNVTAEENFEGSSRVIQFSAVSAPLIVNSWNATSAPNHAFARLAAGANFSLTNRISLIANVSQTLGQPGGDDFTGSGGLKISF